MKDPRKTFAMLAPGHSGEAAEPEGTSGERPASLRPLEGPGVPEGLHPTPQGPALDERAALADYLGAVLDGWRTVAAVAGGALLVGLFTALTADPVYRADTLVQVEQRPGTSAPFSADEGFLARVQIPAETEMQIIRSRSLLGTVVDDLRLDVVVSPRRFPIVGAVVARRYGGAGPAPPLLGLSRYAWGGEHIQVRDLALPRRYEGSTLTLVAGEEGTFRLVAPGGETVLSGETGRLTTSPADAAGGVARILVKDLAARPGTEFLVQRIPRDFAVMYLQQGLRIVERGSDRTATTGILEISLEGSDPRRIAETLDAIAATYLRQNVERKSAEAEKTLEFLNGQLPILKASLEQAESALNDYRSKAGKVDLTQETHATLQWIVEIEKRLSDLEIQRAELRQRFTDSHPAVVAIQQKIGQLQRDRGEVDARLRKLPETELQSARLTRDVEVANGLYMHLLNRAQELKIVKSGTVGNVRIIDPAVVPRVPVRPNRSRQVLFSLVLGLIAGAAVTVARKMLSAGLEDPEAVERATGLPVYANIAHSETQDGIVRDFEKNRLPNVPPLAVVEPGGATMEGMRSLRTALTFALAEAPNNVICIMGPGPGVGKSFTAVNLAHVIADAGKTVLLVDGDLRRGRLHHYVGADRSPGLSDAISGVSRLEDAVRPSNYSKKVLLLPLGTVPPNPAELLQSSRFHEVLAAASARYDCVVVDTPPVLAVTDAALIGRVAGVSLLVLKVGEHRPREIVATLKRLWQGGVRPNGVVLNAVRKPGRRSRYQYYYQYEYR